MADPKGFLKTTQRETPSRRPVPVRILDWREVYEPGDSAVLRRQAGRCMDCGVPFCHTGCPLGNLIPEWNDLTWRGEGRAAIERLHATNNFPEFTGRLCPAPCESACVLGINQPAVTIKQVEVSIIDQAFANGWVDSKPPARLTGKTVAVVGSGPAGLAAAQQLTRAGHTVAVFERDDRIGGLLRYGIPDFKMEKRHLEARLRQMQDEGTRFRAGVTIGTDISWSDLRSRYDAVVIATGSTIPRDLAIPGRDLDGVHFAMEYLVESNKAVAGDQVPHQISAEGKHVIVIGGGDTGADCIGTAHRQGALSVTNLAIGTQPPTERPAHQPWPMTPTVFEVSSAHEEGGERMFLASTVEFLANEAGEVRALRVAETEYVDGRRVPKSGTEREIPADLVLIAMGFTGPERALLEDQLDTRFTDRGNVERADDYETTVAGVFVAGDAGRGQSLIVWAIAEGRAAAASVDRYLMGETSLPSPVRAGDVAIGLQPA
ncbi:MAG: glutamate synthase subunit beta [Microbacterium sp.]|uniref:Glutamate synthase [NADPH] small chain n=1 Tax=Microbacterium ginsengisoli TaxID=400772 RepID=A0A0F0LWK4_9MICO|nr:MULTISPECIES: glutamate synthase subunit beta [Microbacterium]MAL07465.1 glutamate synthase subunit beta [Microbacterium sp.]MCK9914198.1 glutamate synthase subunit beta [Microbacteriaceae bacterium K1510]KJL35776.1 Glutamate synthase [NADPH] small chain [Microbacterium ginsengisoli]MBN9208900.1 glutamate synthase subunit beta [Microbacterium ginsengisoli]HAN23555.1 glutamate synthase subunit beta [Microbacterium ginsengisoli]